MKRPRCRKTCIYKIRKHSLKNVQKLFWAGNFLFLIFQIISIGHFPSTFNYIFHSSKLFFSSTINRFSSIRIDKSNCLTFSRKKNNKTSFWIPGRPFQILLFVYKLSELNISVTGFPRKTFHFTRIFLLFPRCCGERSRTKIITRTALTRLTYLPNKTIRL